MVVVVVVLVVLHHWESPLLGDHFESPEPLEVIVWEIMLALAGSYQYLYLERSSN